MSVTVQIVSFAFKHGVPAGASCGAPESNGGFVFDCRAIPNPGRIAEFKTLTGRDQSVRDYISLLPEGETFYRAVQALVVMMVEHHQRRNFKELVFAFGCTGGQHRSVYFAEKTAEFICAHYPDLEVLLEHRELAKL